MPSEVQRSPRAALQLTPPPPPVFDPTERIYWQDSYLMTSEATVLGMVEDDSQGPAVILDRTIFHPQGGGQPSDQGTITCGNCTVTVSTVRDMGGVIYHFGAISGPSPRPEAGQPVSLALDSAKRLRHAVLHTAGHAVDRAVVGAVGTGVFSPLKGYHFEDSPYVEYRGTLPEGLEKGAFVEKLNGELDKLVKADVETLVEIIYQEHGGAAASSSASSASPAGAAGGRSKHGAATRIVTVAGLSCPCGGTHVRSTRELEGVRVTRVKTRKDTLRVSYTLSPHSPT